jgi:hypothetical protein
VLDFVQPAAPEGGAFAGEGRHGSMMPRSGRVRSRNEYELEAAEKAKQIEGQVVKQVPAE